MTRIAVVFDFDSTVVSKETLDTAIAQILHEHPDRTRMIEEIETITRLGMEGALDFKESVRRRLEAVPVTKRALEDTGTSMLTHITPGMPELFAWLRAQDHNIYIISGGFAECIMPVAQSLGVSADHTYTNRARFADDGSFESVDEESLLWTSDGKAPALWSLRASLPDHTFIMVGDGMNDYRAYESGAAHDFVGFGAHAVRQSVKDKAPHYVHSADELLAFLKKRL